MRGLTTQHHHWDKNTIDWLSSHLGQATSHLRIATGYFSIPGYDALRPCIAGTLTHVLVGFDESATETLREHLLAQILDELKHWHANRYAAVRALANDLGHSLRLVNARTRAHDHGKVYIVDDRVALIGSANLSMGGLTRNSEAATAVTDAHAVEEWIAQFDRLWHHPDTIDITDELRQRLLAWLGLRTPWEVYLKATSVLLTPTASESPSQYYREPAEFQLVVVNRVLKQLSDSRRRGALLVASTGLGKTIMGTHAALELHRRGDLTQAIVFAPRNVHPEWKRRFDSARILSTTFTIDLLNYAKGPRVSELLDALEQADDRTLLIIDEVHRFRNLHRSAPSGRETRAEKRAFARINETVKRTGCRVLLLTATPFATSERNINTQLSLLPHTSTTPPHEGTQQPLSLFDTYPWTIAQVEDLIELDVATVLSTPFVARVFGQHDAEQDAEYLTYPNGDRQYFPSIYLGRIPIALPLGQRVADALDRRYLQHKYKAINIDGAWRRADNLIERTAATAWASSPQALARTLRLAARGDYNVEFTTPPELRRAALEPLARDLEQLPPSTDLKLRAVRTLVRDARSRNQKAVIFTERYETAAYLLKHLTDVIPTERLACLIDTASSTLELRPSADVQRLIREFAPVSNKSDTERQTLDRYDLLIATDAAAEGINLQDAAVLINYDLAWTPDTIIQRAGRVMRLWHMPRTVRLYAFVPEDTQAPQHAAPSRLPHERLHRLEARLKDATTLTELNLMPQDRDHTINKLSSLSRLPLLETANLDLDIASNPDLIETTHVLKDYSTYHQNRNAADALPDDIATVRHDSTARSPIVITIVEHDGEYIALEYRPAQGTVQHIADDAVLRYLRCTEDEQTAFLNPQVADQLRHEALERWRTKSNVTPEQAIAHICTAVIINTDQPDTLFEHSQ